MRDVEPVLAAEREEEVVAGDTGDLLRLEAEQLADAVVLVDDVVADAEVGERGERAAEAGVGTRRPLAEDLRVGEEDETEVAPDEPAPRRRDGEAHARRPSAAASPSSWIVALDLAEQPALAQRLAPVRERDDDAVAGAHEPGELVLGLGQPPRRDRGALRLELERLAARERVELGRARRARPARGPPPPRPRARRPAARRSRARDRAGRRGRRGPAVDRCQPLRPPPRRARPRGRSAPRRRSAAG